jgi:peptidylprolyl isomerase
MGERCTPDTPDDPAPQVEVIAAGSGNPVTPGMSVRVHYVASLPGGAVVHDTHVDDVPSEVVMGSTKTICGFERALLGMRPGEQRRVLVPWQLAFGESGRPPEIPPRSDLVFVIDLYLPADVVIEHGSAPVNPARGGRRR